MRWGNDLLDLAERFREADRIDAAWDVLKLGIGNYGATNAGYAFLWRREGGYEETLLHLDYPEAYVSDFDRYGHVNHDWSISYCVGEPEKVAFGTDERIISRLNPEQLEAERLGWDHDIRHFVVIPLRAAEPGAGGMSVCFRGSTRKEFKRAASVHVEDIRRTAQLFHCAIRRQPGLVGLVELSPRECEILTWVSAGRSSKVIAHRLNLSTRTVEHHIASAQKRLGAHNRTHAVAKALVLNLIQP